MILRYVSDIHIELLKPKRFQSVLEKMIPKYENEILLLAGDIGNPRSSTYRTFMDHISQKFHKTFIIAGNHEYYGKYTQPETSRFMEEFFQAYSNISFLNNNVEKYKGYTFVGSTLWSYISHPEYSINDVYSIPGFDHGKYNQLHKTCKEFIRQSVSQYENCIVMTHHQPSEELVHPKYKTTRMKPYNQWFCCRMDDIIRDNKPHIQCWVYGHTHTPCEESLYDVPMHCNPIGYVNENPQTDYEKYIHLPNLDELSPPVPET